MLNSFASFTPSNKAQHKKDTSKQCTSCSSKVYWVASISRFGRIIISDVSGASSSSSLMLAIFVDGARPSDERFQCVMILSQTTLGSSSWTICLMVNFLCSTTRTDFSLKSASSESKYSSSNKESKNFSAAISQKRMVFNKLIHIGKRSSLSWISIRNVTSSIRCRTQRSLTCASMPPSSSKRWLPVFGPWTTSAAVSNNCDRSLYCSSRPSMEACHSWSERILPMISFAMLQIHSTRFFGPTVASFLSLSRSSSSSSAFSLSAANKVSKSASSMERSSPMNCCNLSW
mmetsp:Transcript_19276/g.57715  ORF Transcript_19276/g.57715 Transcript_19276/m.57715 type:complete len:288 (-) Transcript_19276:1871-2734(-)